MLEIVRQTIQKFQLITTGQTLVVGVSGGTDSLVLLHTLHQLAPQLDISLHAATLDHQLRGDDSAGDVQFVEQICHEWGIAVSAGHVNVASLARNRQIGIEAAAREARYQFLAETAHAIGASTIAVAHHMDDQSETVLLHLLRGSGIHGLAGMELRSHVPGHAELALIRPLLRVTRAEIEIYAEAHHFVPRQDSTNLDTSLLRNAIRLEILPFLANYAPHIKPALARLAEIASVEDDYLEQQALIFVQSSAVKISAQRVTIDSDPFRKLHPALQRRILIWSETQLGKPLDTSANLVMDAVEIAMRGDHGTVALLGGGVQLRREYDYLMVETQSGENDDVHLPLLPPSFEGRVEIPSTIQLQRWVLAIRLEHPEPDSSSCGLSLPHDADVMLRGCNPDDTFSPLGMQGHTVKLNRWMGNQKIPLRIRSQIPLIVINGVVGAICVGTKWFVSETFAIMNTSERIIYFQFLENL